MVNFWFILLIYAFLAVICSGGKIATPQNEVFFTCVTRDPENVPHWLRYILHIYTDSGLRTAVFSGYNGLLMLNDISELFCVYGLVS